MGNRLENGDEVLFRQVHPNFFPNGELSSEPFVPNTEDAGMLSVDSATKTSAEAAHFHYTTYLKKKSRRVYGISVGEFGNLEIVCREDPLDAEAGVPSNGAHCLADYTPFSANSQKNKAKRLKQAALKRGCLYDHEAETTQTA